MDSLKVFSDRGYVIDEAGPVYYTKDMDKTGKWFQEVLGWYYELDSRDAEGKGLYGSVFNLPHEIDCLHIAPFTGIHMFYGEPKGGVVAFMRMRGIEALNKYVTDKDYKNISEIQEQPWGAKVCTVTTPDGYDLQFFESTAPQVLGKCS